MINNIKRGRLIKSSYTSFNKKYDNLESHLNCFIRTEFVLKLAKISINFLIMFMKLISFTEGFVVTLSITRQKVIRYNLIRYIKLTFFFKGIKMGLKHNLTQTQESLIRDLWIQIK